MGLFELFRSMRRSGSGVLKVAAITPCAMLVLLTEPAASPAVAQTEPQADDIVVVARRRHCDISIANRILSDREFRARAKEWAAGRAVQVHVPSGSSYRCQANILFKLHRYGVFHAVFIDQGG